MHAVDGRLALLRVFALLLALGCTTTRAVAQVQLDPRLAFVEQRTPHFVIYSHPGEDALVRRLAAMVEDVRRDVAATLRLEAPALTHIVLADQWDYSNGYATVLPRPVIFMNLSAPSGAEVIGRTDDWLRLLLVHEYTHIVHLDQSRRWAGLLRRVLGRTPFAFPNVFLPRWHVEGLATYVESQLTTQGRLRAGEFRAIDRVAATSGRFDPIDRVDQGLVTWPGPTGVYAYGLGFTAYLSERYGVESLGSLAAATSGGRYSSAFRQVFGANPRQLWSQYKAALLESAPPSPPPMDGLRRLTRRGQQVAGPRFVAPSCEGCPPDVMYSINHPDAFPEMRLVDSHGLVDRAVTTRVLGSTFGRAGHVVVFDQFEYRRNIGVYADLWRLDLPTGRRTALSRELRLLDPDLNADGRIVAVRQSLGQRDLVLAGHADAERLTEADMTVLDSAADTQYYAPRWSPDGTRIVVERRRPGHLSEIVVFRVDTLATEAVFADASTRLVTPTWHPNGTTVVAAADFDGRPFDLYELLPGRNDVRRLTHTDGARWPDVSPDGRTLVFVGYTADGHDVFSVPYPDRDGDRRTLVPPVTSEPAPVYDPSMLAMSVPERYSPDSTLLPTSWFPVLASTAGQVRFGAATFGVDVLGRHTVNASASWLATVGAGVDRRTRPPAWRPDGMLSYAYTRYRPRVGLIGMGSTTFVRVDGETDSGLAPRWRREGELRVDVPLIHALRSATMSAAVATTRDRFDLATSVREQQRLAGRFGVSVRTARTYGYSISPEDGVWAGAWVEQASVNDRSRGPSGRATTTAVDVRGYLPGGVRRAVVATRAVAARSTGIAGARTALELGAAPAGAPPPTAVGSGALGLLRGFPAGAFAGTGLVSLSSDYRVPLWRIERGIGQQWIFVRWLHASVFADAGRVWTDTTEDRTWKRSWGGELSVALVFNELAPITASSGIAWGHDGRTSRGPAGYIRIGRAF